MRIYLIDAMKGLCAHLGKARVDKIRYAQRGTYRRQAGGQNLTNPVLEEMQSQQPHDPFSPVADILTGAARTACGDGKPLNVARLYAILQCMPIINTRQIQLMMALEPRQARRYLAAIRFAMPFLTRALLKRQQRREHGQQQKTP